VHELTGKTPSDVPSCERVLPIINPDHKSNKIADACLLRPAVATATNTTAGYKS
jgi:hypothetical protein